MAEGSGARARWRDALVLTALTGFIVSGLLYYSRGLDEEPNDRAATSALQNSPSTAASGEPTAADSGEPSATPTSTPTDPTTPATPLATPTPEPRGGTCWDGRDTTSLLLCGLPEGPRGLEYVFPTFAEDRPFCQPAATDADSYAVVESYECFLKLDGRSVTVVYEHVEDPARVRAWLLQRMGKEALREVKGSNGGRAYFTDTRNLPSRYTGLYNRFPYVASIFASSPQAARRGFEQLVLMRPESRIRGQRNG